MKQSILFPAALLALSAGTASAQTPLGDMLMYDGSNDQVVLFTDIDQDGQYFTPGEVRQLIQSVGGFEPYDLKTRVEDGFITAYWIESDYPFPNQPPPYNSQVLRGQDRDGSGVIEAGEIDLYADLPEAGPGTFQTISLALTPDDSAWYTSGIFPVNPGFQNGIFRSRDLNGDGDALDAGESIQMIDGAGDMTIDTNGGPVNISANSHARITRQENGAVAFSSYNHSVLFRFEDRNNDGDVTDTNVGGISESIVWLNATGETPILDFNPDFANATAGSDPRSIVVTPTSNGWLENLATTRENGKDIVYAGCGSTEGGSFGMNQFGEPINGLIFRCEDMNNDGDANDAGEVTTFYDGSSTTSAPVVFSKIIGMSANNGSIYVIDLQGNSTPVFYRLKDNNGDNRVTNASEIDIAIWDPSFLPDPPFPTPPGTPFAIDVGAVFPSSFGVCPDCTTYCTAKAGLVCGVPAISTAGYPLASADDGFVISASPARQNRSGILLYSDGGPANFPFQGGLLCVNPPLRRTVSVSSGGTNPCNGRFALDMNAFAAGLLGGNPQPFLSVPGTQVNTQWWGRDSVATGSLLSDAVEYVVAP